MITTFKIVYIVIYGVLTLFVIYTTVFHTSPHNGWAHINTAKILFYSVRLLSIARKDISYTVYA